MGGLSIPRGRGSDRHMLQDELGTVWATATDGAESSAA